MNIAVFGLGYVGSVSSACLARLGHQVIGVDVSRDKVNLINQGESPIVEAGLSEIIANMTACGRLSATTFCAEAILSSDVALICVGTPSRCNGSLDTKYVENVIAEIGTALRDRRRPYTVIVRSTLLPGTTLGDLQPILESTSGKKCGDEINLAYNPEFLREGTAVKDFDSPPYTVIGGIDEQSIAVAASIYEGVSAPIHCVSINEAEMVKYGANAFHAMKITFANEIGNFAKAHDIDGHKVMELLAKDTKLNISPAYLKPGFAYGGSCLPKDLRAILYAARKAELSLPLLESLPKSNTLQIQRAYDMVTTQESKRIGVLGFSFKAGTDDLRESPVVSLIETLIGKGYDLKLYDKNVGLAKLMGANRRFIQGTIPHISELMVDHPIDVVAHADVIVVGTTDPDFAPALLRARGKTVIDLVRLDAAPVPQAIADNGAYYHGICW